MSSINTEAFNQLVSQESYDAILELFDTDASEVRRLLTRLTYKRETLLHAYAIVAFTVLSRERSEQDPVFFVETIRRHLWGMNEEGGNIDWSAPEIIGAIICGNIQRFSMYVPLLYNTAAAEPIFHESLVDALKGIAAVESEPSLTYLAELKNDTHSE